MKYIVQIIVWLLIGREAMSQVVAPASNMPQSNSSNPAITVHPGLINYPSNLKRNFVRTFTPVQPITVANQNTITINTIVPNSKVESQYYDYLGRPLQEVYRWTSYSNSDLVKSHVYDGNGRETYDYLSYAPAVITGKFRTNVLNELKSNYNANYIGEEPYSKKEYDGSPLNRVTKTMLPGKNWVGSNVGVQSDIETGQTIPMFSIGYLSSDIPVKNANYDPDQLYSYKTTDEDGKIGYEIKDKAGKLLATTTQLEDQTITYWPPGLGPITMVVNTFKYTYYVYDDFGRLRCIIPPLADINNLTTLTVNNLCYRYFYDKKGRLVEKKLPGKGIEYYVYDKLDRLIMRQDAKLRLNNNLWHCYIYDVYDRVLGEALYSTTSSRTYLESYVVSSPTVAAQTLMDYLTAYNLVRNPFSLSLQPTDATLITRNYYDDYGYSGLSLNGYDASLNSSVPSPSYSETLPGSASPNTRGLQTFAAARIQQPDGTWPQSWIYTINYYNDKGQVIQTNKSDYYSGTEVQSIKYYFTGEVAATALKRTRTGQSAVTLQKTYLKDGKAQRISRVEQSINNAAFITLYDQAYDFLGRVSNKKLGGKFDNLYTYDIHGWLTGINPAYVDNGTYTANYGPYFGEKISYDKGFASKLYNGNIAGIQWRKSTGSPKEFYGYTYDNANRLLHAEYGKWQSPSTGAPAAWTKNFTDFTASNITYDVNGNIQTMDQRGPTYTSSSNGAIIPGDMDKLAYSYFPNTNKLKAVYDNATGVHITGNPDFQNDLNGAAQDYDYDPNGNLIQDLNKGISTSITYSLHNKPLTITFDDGSTIEYTYDANGNKVQKAVTTAQTATTDTWEYGSSGFVYKNNALQYILHEEGRARPVTSATTPGVTEYTYDFFIKDHLNNVRAVVGTNVIYVSNWDGESDDHSTSLARTYRATMEVANAGVESAVWELLSEVSEVNPYPSAPDDAMAARLNGGEPGKTIGTALMLRTMPGDKIDIAGYNYYTGQGAGQTVAQNNTLIQTLMTALSGGVNIDGIPVTELPENMAILQSTVGNADFTSTLNALDNQYNQPAFPASNLVWVLFDNEMNPIYDKSGSLQASGQGEWALAESPTLEIGQPGYILIFTKSKASKSVFWNELTVKVQQGMVLEEDHYYPFGLTLSQNSANPNERNHIKYNSKELQSELGLNWYNYGARQYDMQIGRWTGIDPLADKYYAISPFAYVLNNPLKYIDPDGKVARVAVYGDQINVSSTIYVMGNNAAQHVQELRDYAAANPQLFKGTYENYKINVNVTYEIATEEIARTKNPGEGNNIMDYTSMGENSSVTTITADPIKNENGVIKGWGLRNILGNYIKMNSDDAYQSSPETGSHEGVGHGMMGLSDRYYNTYNAQGVRETPAHPGFENDKMGNSNATQFNQTHWNNLGRYILQQGKQDFILNRIVDMDENGNLLNQ